AIELPVSTTLMMRSIADVARSEGADLADRRVRLECVMVLGLGGDTAADDAAEIGYFAVREAMSRAVTGAAAHLARHGLAREGAPALVRLIASVAERYAVNVSEKAAAQLVPLVGAVGGAAVNTVFMDHFQSVARGHFTVRRLERRYGEAGVREAYAGLAAAAPDGRGFRRP
ncbi:MAG TPA: EcsC family protein, partial [Burkholderiaceae bacterium]